MAHRLVSSNSPTKYASDASCSAKTAELWNRRSVLKSWAISLTNLWKGSLRIRSSVDFWYLRISRRATVPGLYLWGFLTPPVAGADFLAAFVANCFLGALPPVDFLAVCLVRAIREREKKKTRTSSKQQSTGVRKIPEMQEVLILKPNKSKLAKLPRALETDSGKDRFCKRKYSLLSPPRPPPCRALNRIWFPALLLLCSRVRSATLCWSLWSFPARNLKSGKTQLESRFVKIFKLWVARVNQQ